MDALAAPLRDFADWPARRWLAAAVVALAVALVTGIPTDLVPTSLYRRMTPIPWWSWPLWAATAALAGLLAATYVRRPVGEGRVVAPSVGGGVMSFLAVGCPICNKLVVAALGVSGALSYFAPIQPLLGVAGVVLLGYTLRRRLALSSCVLPERSEPASPLFR